MEIEYDLNDLTIPESILELLPENLRGTTTADKGKFIELARQLNLTQEQAEGIWGAYGDMVQESFQKIGDAHMARQEEADARKVEEAKEETPEQKEARLKATLDKVALDTTGLHLTPEEATIMIDQITSDPAHPYLNANAPMDKREDAISFVNRLYQIKNGLASSLEGWKAEQMAEKENQMKAITGNVELTGKNRSSSSGQRASYNDGLTDSERGKLKDEGKYGSLPFGKTGEEATEE